jgi:hypothetical protein
MTMQDNQALPLTFEIEGEFLEMEIAVKNL